MKDLRAWLQSFRPRQVVGLAASQMSCPLARFVLETSEAAVVKVFPWSITTSRANPDSVGWDCRNLSETERRFVREIDRQPVTRITAQRALRVLDSIEDTP